MIPVGTAVGYLTLDYTQFSSNLKTAIGEATSLSGKFSDTLGKGLTTVGNQIAGVGKTLTTGLTVPIGIAGASAVKFGAEFDKGMSNVAAVSGATTEELGKMREAAISWGEKTVYTATEASDALYYMGLAGWGANESIAGLGPVLNLAAAGDLELGRTSDIVTDAMTSMKLAAGELNKDGIENTIHFTNSLAAAMSNSNTDVDQMGEAFKYVAPLAGALGYDINDLSLALGLMANVGVKGTQAGTGLRQALKNLIAPTDKAQAYMDKFGVSLYDDTGKAKDMRTFMDELRGTFGDLSVDIYDSNGELKSAEQIMEEYGHSLPTTQQEKLNAIVEIFGTRALPGILGIIEQGDDKFTDLADAIDGSDAAFVKYNGDIMPMKEALEKFGDSVYDNTKGFEILGAAEGMAQIQMDNLQGDWIRLTSALGTSKIMISDLVKDSLRGFVQKLTELVQWFNSLDDAQKKHILKIAAIIAAIGPLLLIFGKTVAGIGSVITGFQKMAQAFNLIKVGLTGFQMSMASVAAPMIAIVAVIAVLVAAFVHLWKTNEDFRNKMTAIWDGIKAKFEEFFGAIQERLPGLQEAFTNIVNVIKPIWEGFCEILAPIFEGAFEVISTVLGTILDVIIGLLDIFIGIFTGNWDQVWQGVKEIFGSIWDGITSIFTIAIDTIHNIADVICGWFGTTWNETWTNIKQFFINIWNGITSFFSNVINAIKTAVSNFITTIINFFAQLPTNIANFITNAYNSVVTWVSNMVAKAIEMGQNFLNAVISFFANLPYNVGYFIGNTLANIVVWVVNMVEKAKEMGTNFINNVVLFFTQLPGNVLQFITNAFNNVQAWVINMVNKAREMGTNFINTVVSFFTHLPGKVLQFITNAFDNVQTWVTNMVNKAREMGTNFINNVVSFMQQLPGDIKQHLDSAIANLATWVTDMGQKGTEAVQTLIDNVKSAASDIADKVKSIGSDIVSGVWNGLEDAKDTFVSNVKGFFSGIVDGVKDALGIHSPSKVFRDEVGRWIPPGIANGFAKALPAAMADMESELDDGLSEFDVRDIDIVGLSNSFMTVVTEVTDWFTSIEERLAQTVDAVKADIANLIGVGQLVLNSDGTISGLVMNRPSDSLEVSTLGRGNNSGNGGETINNFTFYSNESIDEIQAAKLLKETQRDLAEGF